MESDLVEERVQVDRRMLEDMISGTAANLTTASQSAADFFEQVEKIPGIEKVFWPARLKIGAKTKKDPFIKIVGTPSAIRLAEEMIITKFKKDRITLKMEISHCEHSFIIGRGGKNTREIMQQTGCHIHFPDCNKHQDSVKNNQVSISGSVHQVEVARSKLRLISPIIITLCVQSNAVRNPVDIPLLIHNPTEVSSRLKISDISIKLAPVPNINAMEIYFKGSAANDSLMVDAIAKICGWLGVMPGEVVCHLNFNIRPEILQADYGLFSLNTIRWIALRTNTQIQFSPQGTFLTIFGSPRGLLMTRRFLMGLLPVFVQFKAVNVGDLHFNSTDWRAIETELEVQISEKVKPGANHSDSVMEKVITLRTFEANLHNAYKAQSKILQLKSPNLPAPNEYAFMRNLVTGQSTKPSDTLQSNVSRNQADDSSPGMGSFGAISQKAENLLQKESDYFANIPTGSGTTPKSPDPTESPIAASLLASAKSISNEKGDFWKAPGVERHMADNREKMLFRASKAIFSHRPSDEDVDSESRQPTDFWAGYGFSNSLPAEILKTGLSKPLWWTPKDDEPAHLKNDSESRMHFKVKEGRPIIGRGADESLLNRFGRQQKADVPKDGSSLTASKIGAPLASVTEEEEFIDTGFVRSLSEALQTTDPGSVTQSGIFKFPSPKQQKKHNFAASSSVFEPTAAFPSDFVWDIRTFNDPSIILTQLGCKEYLPQFRDQEIDIQAFLLLDEANLKDIGVSTMGARKKIFNAILRLRESAKKYGYKY
ncbi:KH domain-containing protein [Ditylenchus destructor]|uniref:KH domain-containing protein n=1 Tax=Ditylenchus destructor TaxID=166010 RepID=A0AAD4QYZ5_9BILA|nr:KH domain-containing protein [Ditylenchus destructor]